MKPAERHEIAKNRILNFRNAYVELINVTDLKNFASSPEKAMNVGLEDWSKLHQKTSSAAGIAELDYFKYGQTFTYTEGFASNYTISPTSAWLRSLKEPHRFPPDLIISVLDSAIAKAEEMSRHSERLNKGIVGLVAGLIRFPNSLAEAVGVERGPSYYATKSIGVVGQIAAAVAIYYLSAILIKFLNFVLSLF